MSGSCRHIEADAATAHVLAERAEFLGVSVAEFLHQHFCGIEVPSQIGDIEEWLDGLTEGMAGVRQLPADFSTRDLYSDHD